MKKKAPSNLRKRNSDEPPKVLSVGQIKGAIRIDYKEVVGKLRRLHRRVRIWELWRPLEAFLGRAWLAFDELDKGRIGLKEAQKRLLIASKLLVNAYSKLGKNDLKGGK